MGVGAFAAVLALACVAPAIWPPRGAADEIEVQLVGFIERPAPQGREALPDAPPGPVARLEVPNEQGGARLVFALELGPRTELAVPGRAIPYADLVVVNGVLADGRIRALRIREIQVIEAGGRLSLPDGPLTVPVTADRLVAVLLDGALDLTVTFLLTPRTMVRRTSLRDGQRVALAVASGTRIVVGLDFRD